MSRSIMFKTSKAAGEAAQLHLLPAMDAPSPRLEAAP